MLRVRDGEALVLPRGEARGGEAAVGPRPEGGTLPPEPREERRDASEVPADGPLRVGDRAPRLVHDAAGERGAQGERDVERPRLAPREPQPFAGPRDVPRLVGLQLELARAEAAEAVPPVGAGALDPRRAARRHRQLHARHRPQRPGVQGLPLERRGRGERQGDGLPCGAGHDAGRLGPAVLPGVDDDAPRPRGEVAEPERPVGPRLDPARREPAVLETDERPGGGLAVAPLHRARERGRRGEGDRGPERAPLRRVDALRRQARGLDEELAPGRPRSLEPEGAVGRGRRGPGDGDEVRGLAGPSPRRQGDARPGDRRSGGAQDAAGERAPLREGEVSQLLGLRRLERAGELRDDEALRLDPDPEEGLLRRRGNGEREAPVGAGGDGRDRLRGLLEARLAPRLRRRPVVGDGRDRGPGDRDPVRDEAAGQLPRVGREGEEQGGGGEQDETRNEHAGLRRGRLSRKGPCRGRTGRSGSLRRSVLPIPGIVSRSGEPRSSGDLQSAADNPEEPS